MYSFRVICIQILEHSSIHFSGLVLLLFVYFLGGVLILLKSFGLSCVLIRLFLFLSGGQIKVF